MSPEVKNFESYSYNTDCWSIGCVLYELITLTKFSSKKLTNDEEIQKEIQSLETLNDFKTILGMMLKVDRENRCESNELKSMFM